MSNVNKMLKTHLRSRQGELEPLCTKINLSSSRLDLHSKHSTGHQRFLKSFLGVKLREQRENDILEDTQE